LTVPAHVVIDGNNLLYAMHEHAPVPSVGRETLVRVVERWAKRGDEKVTIVFDGPPPQGGLVRQMTSKRVEVRFAAPRTADDVIIDLIGRDRAAGRLRIVTSDKAIRHEAKRRRCAHTDSASFVGEIFAGEVPGSGTAHRSPEPPRGEKPARTPEHEVDDWIEYFDIDEDELGLGPMDL
jgi:predicted RNA-binding protein with PIN domain